MVEYYHCNKTVISMVLECHPQKDMFESPLQKKCEDDQAHLEKASNPIRQTLFLMDFSWALINSRNAQVS